MTIKEAVESREYECVMFQNETASGIVGLLTFDELVVLKYNLPNSNIIFKIAKDHGSSIIEYEYTVMKEVTDSIGHIPNFIKPYNLEYMFIRNDIDCNPFIIIDDKSAVRVPVLFMEYVENMITLGDMDDGVKYKSSEILSVSLQTYHCLTLANKAIGFCHNDLNKDNIVVTKCDPNLILIYDSKYVIPTYGYLVKLIDYGESRTIKSMEGKRITWSTDRSYVGITIPFNTYNMDVHLITIQMKHVFSRKYMRSRYPNRRQISFNILEEFKNMLNTSFPEYPLYEDNYVILGSKDSYVDRFMINLKLDPRDEIYLKTILSAAVFMPSMLDVEIEEYVSPDIVHVEHDSDEESIYEDYSSNPDDSDDYQDINIDFEEDVHIDIDNCFQTLDTLDRKVFPDKIMTFVKSISSDINGPLNDMINKALFDIHDNINTYDLQSLLGINLSVFINSYRVTVEYLLEFYIKELQYRKSCLDDFNSKVKFCISDIHNRMSKFLKYDYRETCKVKVINVDSVKNINISRDQRNYLISSDKLIEIIC